MRILAPVAETAQQIASTWEPTNEDGEVAANEMRSLVRELPESLREQATATRVMAGKCSDGIWMDSGARDVLMGLAGFFEALAVDLEEQGRAMDVPHGDDIERMRREDPRAAAWDWGRNSQYGQL